MPGFRLLIPVLPELHDWPSDFIGWLQSEPDIVTGRVRQLAERNVSPLPSSAKGDIVMGCEEERLKKMGFASWSLFARLTARLTRRVERS